jgi:hypothetical protein
MTTAQFVHTEYPQQHPGVARVESAVAAARQMRQGFDSARGLAAMLLAAIVAALLVVADQMIDVWAEGHLLAAWVALWAVGFAAIALLAGTVRRFSANVIADLDAWSANLARRRADERLWAVAQADARLMAELQVAMSRDQGGDASVSDDVVARALAKANGVASMPRMPGVVMKAGNSYLHYI